MPRFKWAASKRPRSFYREASTPNLIILESLQDHNTMLAELDRFAEVCDAGTKVIVIGHVNDVLLYRQLVTRGVSEYLVMPLSVGPDHGKPLKSLQ